MIPKHIGLLALDELEAVPWRELDFAYTGDDNVDVSGDLVYDVKASLNALSSRAWQDGTHALYANIYHQGTVYEATVAAVPYLAAVAAGDVEPGLRTQLVVLLTDIALASSIEAADGASRGAFGKDVAETLRTALLACAGRFALITDPKLAPALAGILTIAKDPHPRHHAPLLELNKQLVAAPLESRAPIETVRYRHPKLGDATLVRRQDQSLVLQFDDGKERVIRESFVTRI